MATVSARHSSYDDEMVVNTLPQLTVRMTPFADLYSRLARAVPVLDGLAGDGADRGVGLVKVGGAVGKHLEKLSGPVAEELVQADLDLERGAAELLKEHRILLREEGELLSRRLGVQHVAERDVLEALGLADVVVVAGG